MKSGTFLKTVLLAAFFVLIFKCACTVDDKSIDEQSDYRTIVDTSVADSPTITESKKDPVKAKTLNAYFSIKNDEFEQTKWATPKSAPKFRNYSAFYCYFAIEDDHAENLRFVFQYTDDDWLFIKDAKFLVDGRVFDYYPSEVESDNNSDGIYEWWDEKVTFKDYEMLRAISNAKSAKVKLSGTQYYKVVAITDKQKLNIARALDYYESLGGVFYRYPNS